VRFFVLCLGLSFFDGGYPHVSLGMSTSATL
jgi:hypothetical protein